MGPDDLEAILARYPAGDRPLSAPEPLGNAGGFSGARLWRYRSGEGPRGLRAWPADGPGPEVLARIHGWLARLADLGFVPIPLPGRDGRTFQSHRGRLWELAPWMAGVAAAGRPPDLARIRAGFRGLAAVHHRLADRQIRAPSPGLARRLLELESLREGGLDHLGRAVDRAPVGPIAADAGRWLGIVRERLPGVVARLRLEAGRVVGLQPCLRDARPDHFLFEGDRLTGLVDFGAMGVDTIAGDLARLLADGIGADREARAEALAAYASVRPLADDEAALIGTFEASNALLGPGRWVRWHFVEGRTFDDPRAVALGLRRGLDRLGSIPG